MKKSPFLCATLLAVGVAVTTVVNSALGTLASGPLLLQNALGEIATVGAAAQWAARSNLGLPVGAITLNFPTFAALAAYHPSIITAAFAWNGAPFMAKTAGYYAPGDGGAATYDWNVGSSATADGLYTITVPSAAGRWILEEAPGGASVLQLGVVMDGVTSTDVTFAAALAACTTKHTALQVPAGQLLLTGASSTTSILDTCALKGIGVGVVTGSAAKSGSMILLTSTSVNPFIVRQDWSVTGVNFYYPNQTTGTTSYPALFTDDGTVLPFRWYLDHVNIINAYDVFVQTAPVPNWGNGTISNSEIYFMHRMAKWSAIGDSINFNSVRFSYGNWANICTAPASCAATFNAALAAADAVNVGIEVQNGTGGVVNVNVDANSYALTIRTWLLIDSGGFWGESSLLMNYDSVGTIIDASSNGHYAIQNKFSTGDSTCGGANSPCFDMGNNSGLVIDNAHLFSGGSLVVMSNGTFIMRNSQVDAIGNVADGSEYYLVHATGGSPIITLQNNSLAGLVSNTHVHGVRVDASAVAALTMQNNPNILYFNDVIDIETVLNGPTVITGNTSQGTAGTGSVIIKGTNGVVFHDNYFDIPPHPTTSSCGTGCTATGLVSGEGHVGSGGSPVTSATLTWPFPFTGGVGGGCFFSNETTSINATVSGTPPTWVLTFGADMRNLPFWFNCPGVQ